MMKTVLMNENDTKMQEESRCVMDVQEITRSTSAMKTVLMNENDTKMQEESRCVMDVQGITKSLPLGR